MQIHQFDHINGQDTHAFLDLGAIETEETEILRMMETKDKRNTSAVEAATTSLIIQVKSQSSSVTESQANDDAVDVDDDNNSELAPADGLHAMILIGRRKEKSGKMWFLIQNTWKELPVFEASESYLAQHLSHKGKIVFLVGQIHEDSVTLPMLDQGLCVESNDFDDVAEDNDDEEYEYSDSDSNLEE